MRLEDLNGNALIREFGKLNARLMGPEGDDVLKEFEAGYPYVIRRVQTWLDNQDSDALKALTYLWRFMELSDREEEGVKLLSRALTFDDPIDETRAFGHLGLGKLLVKQGSYDAALGEAKLCLVACEEIEARIQWDIRPRAKGRELEGVALTGKGQLDRAESLLRDADAVLHDKLDHDYPRWREDEDRDETLRSLLNDVAEANLHLRTCLDRKGDAEGAREALEKAGRMYGYVGNTIGLRNLEETGRS